MLFRYRELTCHTSFASHFLSKMLKVSILLVLILNVNILLSAPVKEQDEGSLKPVNDTTPESLDKDNSSKITGLNKDADADLNLNEEDKKGLPELNKDELSDINDSEANISGKKLNENEEDTKTKEELDGDTVKTTEKDQSTINFDDNVEKADLKDSIQETPKENVRDAEEVKDADEVSVEVVNDTLEMQTSKILPETSDTNEKEKDKFHQDEEFSKDQNVVSEEDAEYLSDYVDEYSEDFPDNNLDENNVDDYSETSFDHNDEPAVDDDSNEEPIVDDFSEETAVDDENNEETIDDDEADSENEDFENDEELFDHHIKTDDNNEEDQFNTEAQENDE